MSARNDGGPAWADMNQYERETARMLVDGYRISQRCGESDEAYFERAKAECLAALNKQVAQVECMGFCEMFPKAMHQARDAA